MSNYFISCILIGENSIVIECGNFLLKHNWQIAAVITDVDEVIKWANNNKLLIIKPSEMNNIKGINVDYLFSIVNSVIIPDNILNSVNKLAINYHDAPLPKYAGVHATSWALSNGERRHGISWHIMSEKIDGGDILIQEKIVVKEYDKVETLNLKCFQVAVKGFEKLIYCIENDCVSFKKQDLRERSYFGKYKKLYRDGLIDWNQRDKNIIRYVNSTLFGRIDNDFLTAKIYFKGKYYIVDKIENYCKEYTEKVGEAKVIGNEEIVVAAKNRPLTISVKNISGEKVELSNFGEDVFSLNADDNVLNELHQAINDNVKSEKYWVEKLKDYKEKGNKKIIPNVSDRFYENETTDAKMNILEKILCFFYQCIINNGIDNYYLGFSNGTNNYSGLCSDVVPFVIKNNNDLTSEDIIKNMREELYEVEKNKTFLLDIFFRYPSLSGMPKKYDYVLKIDSDDYFYKNEANKLMIVVDKSYKKYKLFPYDDEGRETASQLMKILQ